MLSKKVYITQEVREDRPNHAILGSHIDFQVVDSGSRWVTMHQGAGDVQECVKVRRLLLNALSDDILVDSVSPTHCSLRSRRMVSPP
jgi:hypothetical protein